MKNLEKRLLPEEAACASPFPIFGVLNFFSFLVSYWTDYLKFIFFALFPTLFKTLNFGGLSIADPRDAQTLLGIASSEPLKQIANLYGTTASASTPYTKDSDQKQIPPRYMAEITQAVLERLKETIPAQTPTNPPNTVPETPGSAIISSESTDQIHEPSLVMGPVSICAKSHFRLPGNGNGRRG